PAAARRRFSAVCRSPSVFQFAYTEVEEGRDFARNFRFALRKSLVHALPASSADRDTHCSFRGTQPVVRGGKFPTGAHADSPNLQRPPQVAGEFELTALCPRVCSEPLASLQS